MTPRHTKSTVRRSGMQPVACRAIVVLACIALASCGGGPGAVHPDLVVEDPAVNDDRPAARASFTFSATVRNTGSGDAAAATLRVFRSDDETITPAEDEEVGAATVEALAASARRVASVTVTASSTPGTSYYGACADPVAGESDIANNCSAAVRVIAQVQDTEPASPQPDLVVELPSVSDEGPAAGASFTFSATVRNAGSADAAPTTLRVYRSDDATVTASDLRVDADTVGELAAARSTTRRMELTAPERAGTYYYGACVDAAEKESNTANNCSASVRVTVREPQVPDSGPRVSPLPRPDLVVTAHWVGFDVFTGVSFSLSVRIRNAGDATATATVRFYRSDDATVTPSDLRVGVDTVSALEPSEREDAMVMVAAPASTGTYYYRACADAVANESDTENNCSGLISVTVLKRPAPDLVMESPEVNPASPLTGAKVLVAAYVRNVGGGGIRTAWARFYRSTDSTITSSDTELFAERVWWVPATRRHVSKYRTAPSTPGTYYYGACVDAVDGELKTTNNCSGSVAVTVLQAPPPDLTVGTPSVSPSEPSVGDSFALQVKVRNAGALVESITLRYYRSDDKTFTTSDPQVGTHVIGLLRPLDSANPSKNLDSPSTVGTHYYRVCADVVAGESDTTNNCSSALKVDVSAARPKLRISSMSVTKWGGGTFRLGATVKNVGAPSPATTLRFYDSPDETSPPTGVEVGAVAVPELVREPSGKAPTFYGRVDVPMPTTPGAHRYRVCVDAVARESNTTDNCSPVFHTIWR